MDQAISLEPTRNKRPQKLYTFTAESAGTKEAGANVGIHSQIGKLGQGNSGPRRH